MSSGFGAAKPSPSRTPLHTAPPFRDHVECKQTLGYFLRRKLSLLRGLQLVRVISQGKHALQLGRGVDPAHSGLAVSRDRVGGQSDINATHEGGETAL